MAEAASGHGGGRAASGRKTAWSAPTFIQDVHRNLPALQESHGSGGSTSSSVSEQAALPMCIRLHAVCEHSTEEGLRALPQTLDSVPSGSSTCIELRVKLKVVSWARFCRLILLPNNLTTLGQLVDLVDRIPLPLWQRLFRGAVDALGGRQEARRSDFADAETQTDVDVAETGTETEPPPTRDSEAQTDEREAEVCACAWPAQRPACPGVCVRACVCGDACAQEAAAHCAPLCHRHLLASMFLRKSRRKSKSLSHSRRTGANASSAARPCGKHANSSTPKRASSGLLGQASGCPSTSVPLSPGKPLPPLLPLLSARALCACLISLPCAQSVLTAH